MAQWLRALCVLVEDMGSVPRPHILTHNLTLSLPPWAPAYASGCTYTHTCRHVINNSKNKNEVLGQKKGNISWIANV